MLGLNTASYKFALAKSLLKFASAGRDVVTLKELADPFSDYICDHLRKVDRQGTNPTNTLLQACRRFNKGNMGREELNSISMSQGFRYVFEAFHKVSGEETPTKFFKVEGSGKNRRLHLTDEVIRLANAKQGTNLALEVEARWNLVETAWDLGVNPGLIASDGKGGLISVQGRSRRSVAGVKEAVSGYQKGRCFYCNEEFSLDDSGRDRVEIDHFFPLSRQNLKGNQVDLDQIWNLVLACQECNRGEEGKHDRVPSKYLVERLVHRNGYYVRSTDPLKATLKVTLQKITGQTTSVRRRFHFDIWQELNSYGGALWSPRNVTSVHL